MTLLIIKIKKHPGHLSSHIFGALYKHQNGIFAGVDLTGQSASYADMKNTNRINERTLVNAQLGYQGENIEVSLWAKNIFNTYYEENKWDWGESMLIQQGEPALYG